MKKLLLFIPLILLLLPLTPKANAAFTCPNELYGTNCGSGYYLGSKDDGSCVPQATAIGWYNTCSSNDTDLTRSQSCDYDYEKCVCASGYQQNPRSPLACRVNCGAGQLYCNDTGAGNPEQDDQICTDYKYGPAGQSGPAQVGACATLGKSVLNYCTGVCGDNCVEGYVSYDSDGDGSGDRCEPDVNIIYDKAKEQFLGFAEGVWRSLGGWSVSEDSNEVYLNADVVGIGTDNPESILHIKGNTSVQDWGTDIRLDATDGAGGRAWSVISTTDAAGEGGGKFLIKDVTNNTVRLTIDTDGQVGIGTTDPQGELDVRDTVCAASCPVGYTDTGIQCQGGTKFCMADSGFTVKNGKVGIGTTNPTLGKLDIRGDGAGEGISLWSGAGSPGRIWVDEANDYLHITRGAITDVTKGITLDADGDVGIGKAPDAGYKLDVDGNVQATEFHGKFVGDGSELTSIPGWTVDNVNDKVYVTDTDNSVGIGTSNVSSYKLVLESSGGERIGFKDNIISRLDGGEIAINYNSGNVNNSGFSVYNGGTESWLTIDGSNGNASLNKMTTFGSGSLVVGVGQNLIYGNVDTTSVGNLILLQKEGVNKFTVDSDGNVTATNFIGMGAVGGFSHLTASGNYDGSQGGYVAANTNRCGAGHHICTGEEIMYAYNRNPSSLSSVNGQEAWVNGGPPGHVSKADDCSGWTTNQPVTNGDPNYGRYWVFANGGGQGALNSCNSTYKFACCEN